MAPRSAPTFLLALVALALLPGFEWGGRAGRLARELETAEPVRRRAIVRLLASHGAEEARAPVLAALDDPDPGVRLEAARAAGALRLRSAVPRLLDWLDDPDESLRASTAESLGRLGDARAVPGLVRALGDATVEVRRAAVAALARLGGHEVLVPILGRLDDPDVEVRIEAADALATLAAPASVVPLIGQARDDVPEVRAAVLRALGELGDARALAAVRAAMGDPVEEVRLAAVAALGRLADPGAVDALVSLLRDEGGRIARAAVAALGRIPGRRPLEALASVLASPELGALARAALQDAIRRARRAGEDAGVQPLFDRLARDPEGPEGRALAALAIALLHEDPEALDPGPLRAALDVPGATRRLVLRALAEAGDPAAVVPMLEALRPDAGGPLDDAIETVEAYVERGRVDGRFADPLLAVLSRAPAPLRPRIVRLLGRVGAPRVLPELVPLLAHPDGALRLEAVVAIGRLGDAGAAVTLQALLDDPVPAVRFAAAEALGPVAGPGDVEAITRRLLRREPTDRHAATLALGAALGAGAVEDPDAPAGRGALAALADLAAHPDRRLAARAVDALGRWGAPPARAALASLADGGDPRRVRDAIGALAVAGGSEAARVARGGLEAPSGPTRVAAAVALGEAGGAADALRLATLAGEARWPLGAAAAWGAARLVRRAGARGADLEAALCRAAARSRDASLRANVAVAMAALGQPCDGLDPAAWLATGRSSHLRAAAARWLAALDPTAAALVRCAERELDERVRLACGRPALPDLGAEADVYAVDGGGDDPAPLRERLVAVGFGDGSALVVRTDANGHLRVRDVPRGRWWLEDPTALPLEPR